MASNPNKRPRFSHCRRFFHATTTHSNDRTVTVTSRKLRRNSYRSLLGSSSSPSSAITTSAGPIFNDPITADVILRLFLDQRTPFTLTDDSVSTVDENSDVQIYLHSEVLRRANYFSTLLSDRWQHNSATESTDPVSSCKKLTSLNFAVSSTHGSIDTHLTVLELLYTDDLSTVINSASMALDILPVALEFLFEDCVKNCIKFLEAIPWSEEEEKRVLSMVPFLREEESEELLARFSTGKDGSCEEMLNSLVLSAFENHPNVAFAKAFMEKLLKNFSSRGSVRSVLEENFEKCLTKVKQSIKEYLSHYLIDDDNETKAMQRIYLHRALINGKNLVWLVERMIELGMADKAVKEWSEQAAFTGDLLHVFIDGTWRNMVPALPAVLIRCTSKLANAVVTGTILVPRQVRMKLVRHWLPVLVISREDPSPLSPSNKVLFVELEETFLKITSTLPVSDAQQLLQQWLRFSNPNIEACPHLASAFITWFRRAMRPPQGNPL